MRSLIINKILSLKELENFDQNTMRWRRVWFKRGVGIVTFQSKKEKSSMQPVIHISEAGEYDYESLPPEELLNTYTQIIRILSKQM